MSPAATTWEVETLISRMTPAFGALTSVSIFMASMTRITSSAATSSPTSTMIFMIVPGSGAGSAVAAPEAAGAAAAVAAAIPSETLTVKLLPLTVAV